MSDGSPLTCAAAMPLGAVAKFSNGERGEASNKTTSGFYSSRIDSKIFEEEDRQLERPNE
jgi:hypothetical protein